jgi:hypothetical protein
MPTLLYNLELTQDEIEHLWILLFMRVGLMSEVLSGDEEMTVLQKVEELLEIPQ